MVIIDVVTAEKWEEREREKREVGLKVNGREMS